MLDSKWWEGPRWLRNNREQWPANKINCEPKDVIFGKKRKSELVNVNISEELVPCSNSPMSEPVSLPADRVKDANAFDITGIDLAGPLFTRDGGKVWIVLYTCAIYRAIHLELVSSLSTECFMLSLRRFIARRTRPETIYTDNGTNFVGTNSELKNLDWDKIMKETDIKPIKWKFNPPTAAWWGGWWERLVRVIKELLKRTLGKAILTYEELLTVLCDCEAVVNSRPLTYVSEDPNDLIPLTPSLFLNGKSSYDTVDLDLSEFSKFQKRIKYRRKLIHDFRSRFRKEYLGQKRPGKPGHDFKVGDVVMIEEPSKKRVYWPLGKVISLLPGRDGKVRTLKLKCKNSELIRPIQEFIHSKCHL
ncbi:integrase catalytic domain-containing protein [Trichonephila clavipes]|nr:integrase catalytic domain-containing protein [Trichonephila clavipes]